MCKNQAYKEKLVILQSIGGSVNLLETERWFHGDVKGLNGISGNVWAGNIHAVLLHVLV